MKIKITFTSETLFNLVLQKGYGGKLEMAYRLVIQVVQNCQTGEQQMHWKKYKERKLPS